VRELLPWACSAIAAATCANSATSAVAAAAFCASVETTKSIVA